MNISRIFGSFGKFRIDLKNVRSFAVDKVTGLTETEKKLIQDSKHILLRTPFETGSAISHKFFQDHPKYINLFPFKGLSLHELKDNQEFLDQCLKLSNAIRDWTGKLDDPEELKSILEEIRKGYDHPGFDDQYFKDFRNTFVNHIDPLMDAETKEAWNKLLKFAMNILAEWNK